MYIRPIHQKDIWIFGMIGTFIQRRILDDELYMEARVAIYLEDVSRYRIRRKLSLCFAGIFLANMDVKYDLLIYSGGIGNR